jgi:hypothetical protein
LTEATVGQEHLASASVIWAAGVQASPIGVTLGAELDRQGRVIVRADLSTELHYVDKGQMATIGRRRAVMQHGGFRSAGVFAWILWLLVHIYFLTGFRNRLFVLIQWSWSYLTFARGTRLIVEKEWRSHAHRRPAVKLSTGPRPIPPERARAMATDPSAPREPAAATPTPLDAPFLPAADLWDEPTTAYPPVRGT